MTQTTSISSRNKILSKLKAQQSSSPVQIRGDASIHADQQLKAKDKAQCPAANGNSENSKNSLCDSLTKSSTDELSGNLRANHTEVIMSTTSKWLHDLQKFIHQEDIKSCVISQHAKLKALIDSCKENGDSHVTFPCSKNLAKETLFQEVDAAICFAEAAAADPGCLYLSASAEQPRLLSLVPPLSILVVTKETIFASLKQLATKFSEAKALNSSNLILISGPSKTADIQQTLAYGAHGPKRLVVFIIH
jgi:L-lactate dehydrogenase complex protein LldG